MASFLVWKCIYEKARRFLAGIFGRYRDRSARMVLGKY